MILVDIETVPDPAQPRPTPDTIRVPGNIKKPESIEAYRNNPENLEAAWRARSTDPLMCKIVCIGYSVFEYDKKTQELTGDWTKPQLIAHAQNEEAMLQDFWAAIAAHPHDTIIAYRGWSFDFKILAFRALRYSRFNLSRRLWPQRRFNDPLHLDISQVFEPYTSFAHACRGLLIPYQSEGGGSLVYEQFMSGDHHLYMQHCLDDIRALTSMTYALLRGGMISPQK